MMVLGTILVVVILINIVLSIISSQARLTHHQVSRIQAYYAGQAALNLAFEKLRTGDWEIGSFSLCKPELGPCTVTDPDIPYRVDIVIDTDSSNPDLKRVTLNTNYTYSP